MNKAHSFLVVLAVILISAFLATSVFAQSIPVTVPFSKTMQRGSSSDEIRRLQTFLKTMPDIYPEGLVTGYFGLLTEKAVQRFQSKYGIVSSGSPTTTGYGLVGLKTRARLNSLISPQTVNQQLQPQQLQSQPQQPQPQLQSQPQQLRSSEISVKSTGAKYKSVSAKPTTGWFKTGQGADIMLSGVDFNNTGGPLFFNHPSGIASDGKRLLLADTWNNRVLIWNTLPQGNVAPDLVLGQKNFITNNSGTESYQLNWPISISTARDKLVVADTNNGRLLIWNSFPTQNAQPADLILNLPQIGRNLALGNFGWPWGVWTDGQKLAVSATQGSRVLIWNTFPARGDQPPDIVLSAQGKFGTPRGITSNGQYLIVGDHNAKVVTSRTSGPPSESATFVWKTWPSSNDQSYDFFLEGTRAGTFLPDNRLILMSTTHFPVSIWNAPPTSADDAPDLILGQTADLRMRGGLYYFIGGDGSGITWGGGRLYFGLANGNKIVAYNGIPHASGRFPEFAISTPDIYNSDNFSDQFPDFAIGSPDIYTNTLETNFMLGNPVVASDGKSLFASSDFEQKLYVWKSLPDESSADPDWVYSFPADAAPWDNAIWGNTLALAGRNTVYIWKKLPLGGEMPDLIFRGTIGNISLKDIHGVALDDKYFYLSDANKVYVWESLPSQDRLPKYTLTTDQPQRLSSDGKYLLVIATLSNETGHLKIFPIDSLSDNAEPTVLKFRNLRTNLPLDALLSGGHLFVADSGFHRALIWKNIEDALAGNDPDTILGAENLQDVNAEIGRNKLFSPASLAFDGSFLWLGEFKFSGRILRFSIQP